MQASSDVTQLLLRVSSGDQEAVNTIVSLLYEELREVASDRLRSERPNHTLSTTALVNEAYLRLIDIDRVQWRDRSHFLAVASRVMRRVLVDYARMRRAKKRGGGWKRVPVAELMEVRDDPDQAIEDLDEALTRLEKISPRHSHLLEHRFFGGLTLKECAEVLGVSVSTVKNDLRFARAWLTRELGAEGGP